MPEEEKHTPLEQSDSSEISQDRLSGLILDFLSSPWIYASSERLHQATQGHPLDFYHSTPRAWQHFTRHAYAFWNLTPFWYDFPADDNSRLLLLPAGDTEKLELMLGLLALAPELKNMISGEEIRSLKESFPGLYPDCLRLTGIHPNILKKLAACTGGMQTGLKRETVAGLGRKLLDGMLSHLPEELLRRWQLKFSTDDQKTAIPSPLTRKESNGLLLFLLHHLNPESWQLCCY